MLKYQWLLIGLLFTIELPAATKDSTLYNRQVSLLVDNDVFTSLWRDQYYSSGLFGTYSWLANQTDSTKNIRSITLAQRMFTPMFVTWDDVEVFDRPYAGHLSIIMSSVYLHSSNIWKHQLELGWMGPGSLTGQIQQRWHDILGLPLPKGWEYEIQNSPIINYYGTFGRKVWGDEQLEMLSETNIAVGTAFDNIRTEIVLKTGMLKDLLHGVQYNGQFGIKKTKQKSHILQEFVLFYAPGIEHSFFNSTIEGNPFGKDAPHTETPVRWIGQHRFGILLSWQGFDITVNYYRRTKETTESTSHQYAGVQLARRF
jgi:lipid A 3-O-deacylase